MGESLQAPFKALAVTCLTIIWTLRGFDLGDSNDLKAAFVALLHVSCTAARWRCLHDLYQRDTTYLSLLPAEPQVISAFRTWLMRRRSHWLLYWRLSQIILNVLTKDGVGLAHDFQQRVWSLIQEAFCFQTFKSTFLLYCIKSNKLYYIILHYIRYYIYIDILHHCR